MRAAKTSIIPVVALVVALLVCRLIVLLMAGRPDNAGIDLLMQITNVLVWPLAWLDATQPVYGSRFERGTLTIIVVTLIGLRLYMRRSPKS